MQTDTIILAIVILAGFAGLAWFLNRKGEKPEEEKKDDQSLMMLQNQLNQLTQMIDSKINTVDAKMGETTKRLQDAMQHQSSESVKIIRDITERLTKVDSVNQQVLKTTEELNQLQEILKNPKQRGTLGEYFLENVLQNVLPPGSYQMQYSFESGDIVDAVVFVKDKKIPVDSKFSLDNYNRIVECTNEEERKHLEREFKNDLKKRIDETSKYIKPSEGTVDFAFMFIPAEGIYYDLLINQVGAVKVNTQDLIEYAMKDKRVIIVSPTSFLAYLQTVLQGLRAMQIEESAKEIRKRVEMLGKHLLAYHQYHEKLGKNLGTTVSAFNQSNKEFGKIDKDVVKITGATSELPEIPAVDKPLDE